MKRGCYANHGCWFYLRGDNALFVRSETACEYFFFVLRLASSAVCFGALKRVAADACSALSLVQVVTSAIGAKPRSERAKNALQSYCAVKAARDLKDLEIHHGC